MHLQDNPFMAGAFHGVGEARNCAINVGVIWTRVLFEHALAKAVQEPSNGHM